MVVSRSSGGPWERHSRSDFAGQRKLYAFSPAAREVPTLMALSSTPRHTHGPSPRSRRQLQLLPVVFIYSCWLDSVHWKLARTSNGGKRARPSWSRVSASGSCSTRRHIGQPEADFSALELPTRRFLDETGQRPKASWQLFREVSS